MAKDAEVPAAKKRAAAATEAENYYNAQGKRGFNLYLIIDPLRVDVTIKGGTEEIIYDGGSHPLDMFEAECSNDLYDVRNIKLKDSPIAAKDADVYDTGVILEGCLENGDPNFSVHFEYVKGTFTIKPAPLTLYTDTGREMAQPPCGCWWYSPRFRRAPCTRSACLHLRCRSSQTQGSIPISY